MPPVWLLSNRPPYVVSFALSLVQLAIPNPSFGPLPIRLVTRRKPIAEPAGRIVELTRKNIDRGVGVTRPIAIRLAIILAGRPVSRVPNRWPRLTRRVKVAPTVLTREEASVTTVLILGVGPNFSRGNPQATFIAVFVTKLGFPSAAPLLNPPLAFTLQSLRPKL